MKSKLEAVNCTHLVKYPNFSKFTDEQDLKASIVGFLTGDGTITIRNTGNISGAFYSECKTSLEMLLNDCHKIGMLKNNTVTKKLGGKLAKDTYQLQFSTMDALKFIGLETPYGKKVEKTFNIPKWILASGSTTKAAYLSGLFGAEGSKLSVDTKGNTRMPKVIIFSMCKKSPSITEYFAEVEQVVTSLGISCKRVIKVNEGYYTGYIYIHNSAENAVKFINTIGYSYCKDRALEAFKWVNYLSAYVNYSNYLRAATVQLRDVEKLPWKDVARSLNRSVGSTKQLYRRVKQGHKTRAGNSFPFFYDWLFDRWFDDIEALKLDIVSNRTIGSELTYNINVDSPDRDYLLASGISNFNSFITMLGRVYYAFDMDDTVRGDIVDNGDEIHIGMDFNVGKMCAVCCQVDDGKVYVFDEIVLMDSNTREMCVEIARRFPNRKVTVYPDASGKSRKTSANAGQSDFSIITSEFGFGLQSPPKNPPVADRVNSLNSMLQAADGTRKLFVSKTCKEVIMCLDGQVYKEGTNAPDKQGELDHMNDALGYFINYKFSLIKREVKMLTLDWTY